jgi:hypothetical protein
VASHYVRIDEQNRVIKSFSTDFEQPLEGDKLVAENAGRHYNLDIYGLDGVLKYKWVEGTGVVERTQEEKQPEINAMKKASLQQIIIDLQKRIDACANLLTYTGVNASDIEVEMNALITERDNKIVEYNNL